MQLEELCRMAFVHFWWSQYFVSFFFFGGGSEGCVQVSACFKQPHFYRWGVRSPEKTSDLPKATQLAGANSYSCALSITPLLEISAVLRDFRCSALTSCGREGAVLKSLACLLCASCLLRRIHPVTSGDLGKRDFLGVYFWILLFAGFYFP